MKLVNLSNENEVAIQVNEAYRFFKRLKGLMFTKQLSSGNGLHIARDQFRNDRIKKCKVNARNIRKTRAS